MAPLFPLRALLTGAVAAAVAVTVAASPSAASPAAQGNPSAAGDFALTSTAFADNKTIPDHYTCAFTHKAGKNVSPPLAWGAGATNAKGYAIILRDVANGGDKVHWAIWNLTADTLSLPEGLSAGYTVPGQNGAKQKAMGSGSVTQQYFGPCPGGREHPYTFTLYAVKSATVPGLSSSSSMSQIESAIKKASSANVVLHGKSAASAN
ncbi:Raf kinase inhibitor-like YbhB/YbcL family protein [Kutzneria kofuensis]|uniref:Raf kinase inhibitor-like YbhB/YbcL family protein n=1 Tax=Kutzneria kofuensis TaxID=103725 RepID=A0A7W9NKQ8_9PSEU|nr:Raf kinase inhibitor-like YbhB/YbcL family protein [Kutzneria kofuensis]